jgi:tRNA(adenine34) deaminase
MRRCIELALIAGERGDSPVGSIIVMEGEIIAEGIEGGRTHHDITFHAEIEAIRRVRETSPERDLSHAIMYTTHEPCIMCSYVIRHARIGTVVMALTTGETGGYSSAYPILSDRAIGRWGEPPEVITGILKKECEELQG